jgi:hypothetical protein
VIELRGTGGGLFRALYAAFLREAEAAVPALAPLGLSARMAELAEAWASLARDLRDLAGAPGGAVPRGVVEAAAALARDERRFHEDLAARVP